jgi:hypothetical protein
LLARAALTQLRHGDLVLQFQEDLKGQRARATVRLGDRTLGPITDPSRLSPALATDETSERS